MVASLDHPHIVPVYDFVENESACLLIMERCTNSVGDRFKSDGIATDEACAAILACLAALDFAHGRGPPAPRREARQPDVRHEGDGQARRLRDRPCARRRHPPHRDRHGGRHPRLHEPRAGARRRTHSRVGRLRGRDDGVRAAHRRPPVPEFDVGERAPRPSSRHRTVAAAHDSTGTPRRHRHGDRPCTREGPRHPPRLGPRVRRRARTCVCDRIRIGVAASASVHPALARHRRGHRGAGPRLTAHRHDHRARASQAPHDVITPSEAIGDATPPPPGAHPRRRHHPPRPAAPPRPRRRPQRPPEPPVVPPAPPTCAPACADRTRTGATPLRRPHPVDPGCGGSAGRRRARGRRVRPGRWRRRRRMRHRPPPTRRRLGPCRRAVEPELADPELATRELDEPDPTVADTPTSEPATEPTPASTAVDVSGVPEDSTTFSNRPEGYAPRVADSWLTPTPCPEGQQRVACIISGVGFDPDTGELNLGFFTEGFVPELEPPGHHVHFYFDTQCRR